MSANVINLKDICAQNPEVVYQQSIEDGLLTVKETVQYRWIEFGGNSVQSIMKKTEPSEVVTPVSQTLLIFLLFTAPPTQVLNLGLGGAAVERALAAQRDVHVTSVEASQPVIDIAKRYFGLPERVNIFCQNAENFIRQTAQKFDVVVCDLFSAEKNPGFLLTENFYAALKSVTTRRAVLTVNIQAQSEEQLLTLLMAIRKYFAFVALIEFADYRNIVVLCSSHELPTKETLLARLEGYSAITFTQLNDAIERMHYIPALAAAQSAR